MNEYGYARMKDIQEIKTLWNIHRKVKFSVSDNWVEIGGVTFNGVSKSFFEKIVELKFEEKPVYDEEFINSSCKERLIEAILKWKPSIVKTNLWKMPKNDLCEILRKIQKGETNENERFNKRTKESNGKVAKL